MPYEDAFATNLRMMLGKRHMSQKDLASASRTTEAAVSRYCNGERIPSVQSAARLAEALDCTIDQLMGRELITSDPHT